MVVRRIVFATGSVLTLAGALVLPLHRGMPAALADTRRGDGPWQPWAEFGGYWGNVRSRGELVVWAPIIQDTQSLFFVDVRGKLFEAGAEEGNLAFGFREMLDGSNIGVWGGIDVRRSVYENTFTQAAGGLEWLSRPFDVRLNGYLPINRSELVSETVSNSATATSSTALEHSGGSVTVRETVTTTNNQEITTLKEFGFWGFDGEIGFRLPIEQLWTDAYERETIAETFDLRLYAGGYYFDNDDVREPMFGPRLRLVARWHEIMPQVRGSLLTAEAELQHDDIRSTQFEAGLRLRIPLSPAARAVHVDTARWRAVPSANGRRDYLRRRMTDGLERDTDIVRRAKANSRKVQTIEVATNEEAVVDTASGAQIRSVTVVDARSDLGDELGRAGENAIVVADGSRGAFVNDAVKLGTGQQLIGGGSKISLAGAASGRVYAFAAPGLRPTIAQTDNAPVIVIASGARIAGVDVRGGGAQAGSANVGIETAGKSTAAFSISDVSVTSTGGHGFRIHSYASDYAIVDSRVSDVAGGNGIDIENDNRDFRIANTTISDIWLTSGDAIHLSRMNSGTLEGVTFGANIADHALRLRDNNTISGHATVVTTGQRLCQQFGGANVVTVTFGTVNGCE